MYARKIRFMIAVFLMGLVLAACGQISVGVVTPTESYGSGELPQVEEPVATPEQATQVPDVEEAPVPTAVVPTVAYVGLDYNLWLIEAGSETPRQLTADGNPIGNADTAIEYSYPRHSSDGTLLAYRRDVSTPSDGGYDFTSGMWVMDLQTGEATQILDGMSTGMAWKPDTHLLAYAAAVETEYFLSRGEPSADLAKGIRGYDFDTREDLELVGPERGFALAGPAWSPDGRFLSFAEIIAMEGSGMFAYFDFSVEQYYSWEEPVGFASWSPNGGLLTYARHVYVASGEERLYLRGRVDAEQTIGPDYEGPAYATLPVFSPGGERIAYLAFLEGPDVNVATITVLDVATGEVQAFGQFEGVWELAWAPDGSHVIFQGGAWDAPQIILLDVTDGTYTTLAEGRQPSLAGR